MDDSDAKLLYTGVSWKTWLTSKAKDKKTLDYLLEVKNLPLNIEINVAFDDNEFYSEFDFPDDDTFHNGTGQLGQPSIVFNTAIDMKDGKDYYLMELIGHGHHSGQNGTLYIDLSRLVGRQDQSEDNWCLLMLN